MDTIQVKDKQFQLYISEQEIQKEIERVASEINRDFQGREPLFLCILNGSFMFAADLLKSITLPCNVSFVKTSSYLGTSSTGVIKELIGLNESIEGRDVIIVEDIVDTGVSMSRLVDSLNGKKTKSLSVCTLLSKPDKIKGIVDIRYVAKEVPDFFLIGCGLDYYGLGRNLRDIYKVV